MTWTQWTRSRLLPTGLIALTAAWTLVAYGGAKDSPSQQGLSKDPSSGSSGGRIVQPQNTEGRLLASNCFQCHGTMGTGGFDSIRGGEAEEVLEYMTKTASRDIMAAHAQGYTTAQLRKIIAYLQQ